MNKYTAALDYADKTLIGILAGVISASLILVFSLTTGIIKKLLKETREKKKKHSKTIMLAKSKLNSIESFNVSVINILRH